MTNSATGSDTKRQRSSAMRPLKVLAAALAIAALIKELRLPKEQRTWNGAVAGFVPYDFRMPSVEKIKSTVWNPDGAIIVSRAFGVGWTVNLGAIVTRIRSMSAASGSQGS